MSLADQPKLISFAERLAQSTWRRHLLFLGATILTVVFVGYWFGTGDQIVHLPFLYKTVDPSLYPNDAYLELRHQHYTFFWWFFIPFYRAGGLEMALFVTHCLTLYGAFWVIWALAEELFHNALTSVLSVVTLAFPHLGFAGWPLFEFSLLPKLFVLPFLLLAILLWLKQRPRLALALLGVMYNLHVISVNFVLVMFGLDAIRTWRRAGTDKRATVLGLLAFVVLASPVLIWRSRQGALDLSLRPEWLSIVTRGALYNLFHLIRPYPHTLAATLSGLSILIMFFIARRDVARHSTSRHTAAITTFMLAIILILVVEIITAEWWPITLIIQMQIIRAGLFALVFGNIYFAYYVARQYQASELAGWDFRLMTAALAIAPVEFIVLGVWAIQRWRVGPIWRRAVSGLMLVGLSVSTYAMALALNAWAPGVHIFAQPTPFNEAQRWAKTSTPKEAIFIVPPQRWWIYESEWRVFSQRSTTPQLADLLVVAFVPDYLNIWEPGFEQVAPGAAAQFNGDWQDNWDIGARAFYGLSDEALLAIARDWHATYLVVEIAQSPARPWPVVYENSQYQIYELDIDQ